MKSALLFLFACTAPIFLYGQSSGSNDTVRIAFARIELEVDKHNFGDVYQGQKAEKVFTFKNTGDIPLMLNNVLSTCGCTVPEWPKSPIQSGDSSQIKVIFDSTSKIGRQNKVITIRSNSKDGDARIRISAMVLPAKKK